MSEPIENKIVQCDLKWLECWNRQVAVMCSGPNRNRKKKFCRRFKKHWADAKRAMRQKRKAQRVLARQLPSLNLWLAA